MQGLKRGVRVNRLMGLLAVLRLGRRVLDLRCVRLWPMKLGLLGMIELRSRLLMLLLLMLLLLLLDLTRPHKLEWRFWKTLVYLLRPRRRPQARRMRERPGPLRAGRRVLMLLISTLR